VIVVDVDAWKLYELFDARPVNSGGLMDRGLRRCVRPGDRHAAAGRLTSADAAGLPIFAGLVRYDEAVTTG